MTGPAETVEPAAASPTSSGLGYPNINPASGLSTDYLNHFTEAIMALEMAHEMPECLEDLRQWRPKTYPEHFEASRFHNREALLQAYLQAEPALRTALDDCSAMLNQRLSGLCELTVQENASTRATTTVQRALRMLRPHVARMTAIINGASSKHAITQAMIDAMFGR